MEIFDLTSEEGRQAAKSFLEKNWEWLLFPQIKATQWATKKILDLFNPKDTIQAQKEFATEIIKAGKENNVESIEIEVDNKVGAHFECPVEGAQVEMGIGTNNKMKIKVRYKKD